jgi:hypothetical protein
LSRRQLDNGVNLNREVPRCEVDVDRARIHGLHDLLSLSARRRHPDLAEMADAFDGCIHVGSALLDLSDDPIRPGRWLPDTIGARHRPPLSVRPVEPDLGSEITVIEQMAAAVAAQGERILMEDNELCALQHLATDAQSVFEKVTGLLDDPEVQAAWALVPAAMAQVAERLRSFLVGLVDAVTNESDDVSHLMELAQELAPVTRVMTTFLADLETAMTPGELREVMLRLPKALGLPNVS